MISYCHLPKKGGEKEVFLHVMLLIRNDSLGYHLADYKQKAVLQLRISCKVYFYYNTHSKFCVQDAHEESKAVTKAAAMKGNLLSVAFC